LLQQKEEMEISDEQQYNHHLVSLIHGCQGLAHPIWFVFIFIFFFKLDYAKRVFGLLKRTREKFEFKIMLMNFLSRLISCHKLILFKFYSHLHPYLQPSQINITVILAITAQSVHEMVDPDVVKVLIRTIADNFIHHLQDDNVIAIGYILTAFILFSYMWVFILG